MVSTTVTVLGSNGFLGSNLLEDFKELYVCRGLTRDNYNELKNIRRNCSVFVNAAGNSKKMLPEANPLLDFDLSVRDTLKSIIDFSFDTYVYLSSCEVYGNDTKEDAVIDTQKISKYALSKYLTECLVKKYCQKWIILRLNGPVGRNMKKGPVFDILHGDKIWLSPESEFQFLHTSYISRFINLLINKGIANETFNLTGKDTLSLGETMSTLSRHVNCPYSTIIKHNVNVEKAGDLMDIPTSLESIKQLRKI